MTKKLNAVNFEEEHLQFFLEKRINKCALIRELVNNYPDFQKWKSEKSG